uniref:ribonuclease H n=1 Tax=Cacopsylla melanoneura TaxID=428564 RepID=A0A8D8UCR9_9HEMI
MLALTNTKPIMRTIEEQALIQYEKIKRLPQAGNWCQNIDSNPLKSQPGFLQKVKDIIKNYHVPNTVENLETVINPMEYIDIQHSLNIEENFKKQDVAPIVAKAKALETVNTLYPLEQWTHVFTDGSLQNPEVGAGAGATCKLFSFYRSLGPYTTNFDGEVEAIKIALTQLLFQPNLFGKVVILTDSKAAIQAIINPEETPSFQIREIRQTLKHLKLLKKVVVLQWIPAHCGIHGNETADFLAKKGTEIKGSTLRKLPLVSAKRLIKNENNKKHKLWINKEGENKSWKNLIETPNIIPELPRKAAVASFRLLTGHDCLNHYLHRFKIKALRTHQYVRYAHRMP